MNTRKIVIRFLTLAVLTSIGIVRAQSTPPNGVPKTNDGGSAQKSANGDQTQKPAPNVTVIVQQQPATTSEEEKKEHDQENAINWSIAKFTKYLVIVGGIQAGIFLLQFVMMWTHAGHLKHLAVAASNNAIAARESADSLKKSERAHVWFELEKPSFEPEYEDAYIIEYKIRSFGKSLAFITKAECVSDTILSPFVNIKDEAIKIPIPVKEIFCPSDTFEGLTVFHSGENGSEIISDIRSEKQFVIFRGLIEYTDAFGQKQFSRFNRVWKFTPYIPANELDRIGYWEKCGLAEDNQQT